MTPVKRTNYIAEYTALIAGEAAYMQSDTDPVIQATGHLLTHIADTLTNPPSLVFRYDYESTAVAALNIARAYHQTRA